MSVGMISQSLRDMFLSGVDYEPALAIDLRHRDWMAAILSSAPLTRILEIGCGDGVSASAVFEAQHRGAQFEAHFCDLQFRPTFHAVSARRTVHTSVLFHEMSSVEFIVRNGDIDFDFIFVDGDHTLATVRAETEWLLNARPRIIMAHDTTCRIRGAVEYEWCNGPEYLKWAVQDAGYRILEDSLCRPGEATDRGMLAAVRDDADFQWILDGFRSCCRPV
jgi:hypothetical protein